ncbi:MAG: hypothetical protein JXA99_14915, partial [Candidatus Lokiarchaeota archaeon]|nr:hypothetical protein [Candidatus Lokiarchaeota archaeon]
VYLDAFSFSSDSNYNIGDNLNEGLLLSYTNTTQLDWKGYSLDGQTNRTILGNTTISLPNNGLHSIQVFGNDSSSNYYSSDLRYFTVDTGSINLITPENITYTEPMAGYYPGTYSFENDNIGEFPIKWEDITQNHTYCSVEVQKEYKGHSNILQFYDGYSDPSWTSHAATCELDFTTTTMDIIEFWFLKASGTTSCEFQIREDDNIKIDFGVDPANNGQWQWRTSTDWIYLPEEYYQDDEWIHVRIDFDMVNDIANFTINNEIVLSDADIFNNTGNVNKIRMGTNTGWEGVVYLDAFSFSSDSNYNIGYNLNEGLLLSFTNTTQLDWMGYSLDGLANRTIMGNTTISLPNNGAHTIQVFGNKSLGEYIASNFVQFTIDIDLTPPEIIGINTILEIQQYSYCRINWTLLSPNGGTYQIFINDIFAGMSTFENSDVISITVDTHSSGQFNYTIIAIDSHENPAYHDVIIKVKEKDKPIIPGYDLLALFMISAISICIIGFIKKNKFKPNT